MDAARRRYPRRGPPLRGRSPGHPDAQGLCGADAPALQLVGREPGPVAHKGKDLRDAGQRASGRVEELVTGLRGASAESAIEPAPAAVRSAPGPPEVAFPRP